LDGALPSVPSTPRLRLEPIGSRRTVLDASPLTLLTALCGNGDRGDLPVLPTDTETGTADADV
jgi:hypothetical protein